MIIFSDFQYFNFKKYFIKILEKNFEKKKSEFLKMMFFYRNNLTFVFILKIKFQNILKSF